VTLNFFRLSLIANLILIIPVIIILWEIFLTDGAAGFDYFKHLAGAGFYVVMGAIVGALSPSFMGLIAKFKK